MAERRRRALLVAGALLLAGCEVACGGTAPTTGTGDGWQTGTQAATAAQSATPEPPVVVEGVATRVVDGDTVRIEVEGRVESVRLIGIDTPETGAGGYRDEECGGAEDTLFLQGLLPPGEPVNVELGVEQRDQYGRLLGYLRRVDDGLFVNLEIAISGYGTDMAIFPNTAWADIIAKAVLLAQEQQLGLWAVCGQ